MKFSLFLEIPVMDPTRQKEYRAIKEAIALAVLADQAGYDCIWAVEHHGLYEYSHCSAPESVLAHLAAKTSRIRLGHGVALLPHNYTHPMRVAERVAMLDNLSDGRVNLGTGKSASQVERQAFHINPETFHDEWLTSLRMMVDMWTTEIYSCDNKFFKMPPTPVLPKPVQEPHPPIFAACSRPAALKEAGALGVGALHFSAGTSDYIKDRVRIYQEASATPATPLSKRVTRHFACTVSAITLPNDEEACRYGFRGGRYFGQTLRHYLNPDERPIGRITNVERGDLTADELQKAMQGRSAANAELTVLTGDKAAAKETVQRFVDTGIDELILVMELGNVPNDITMQSVRYFAENVIPHFR